MSMEGLGHYRAASTGEHTGTLDDTHLVGTDNVETRGNLVGILITKFAAGTITLYDTKLPTGAGAYAAEPILVGPMSLPAAGTPSFLDIPPRHFKDGLGVDISDVGIGVELFYTKG